MYKPWKNRGKHRGYVVYNSHNVKVNISGDTTFNFKDKKYIFFKRLIEEDKEYSAEDKQKYLKVLDDCKSMVYSLHNFALMPQTGGLNIFKGSHMDRLDKFLYFLDKYIMVIRNAVLIILFFPKREGEEKIKRFMRRLKRVKKMLRTILRAHQLC